MSLSSRRQRGSGCKQPQLAADSQGNPWSALGAIGSPCQRRLTDRSPSSCLHPRNSLRAGTSASRCANGPPQCMH